MPTCYLRKTELVLEDGNTYVFRALPLTRRTLPMLRAILDDDTPTGDKLEAMVAALELSMSYDQSPEVIEAALECGVVAPNNQQIMAAMGAGMT